MSTGDAATMYWLCLTRAEKQNLLSCVNNAREEAMRQLAVVRDEESDELELRGTRDLLNGYIVLTRLATTVGSALAMSEVTDE